MTLVNQILHRKGNIVWSVSPDTPIFDVLKLMNEKGIGAVLILDDDKIQGIFSERDYARASVQAEKCSLDSPVRKFMTKIVFYIHPDLNVEECMALMTEKHIRHLPVVENDKLIGIISIGDVVKEMISMKNVQIQSMESYIMGRDYHL